MAFDLFDLAAKLSVDTREFNEKLTGAQRKVLGLAGEMKALDKSTGTTGSGLFKMASQATGVESSLSSLGSFLPSLAGGLTLATAAAGALVFGLYELVISSAEATGKLKDLSQQTGFSVETLSAMGNAAETTGGSIETVTGALGIFEKNMENAHDKTNELSRVFTVLNIDIDNNEKALRQAFTALSKLPEGAQQTALAMKLFGRSGREVLAIIKETGGDLDVFMGKLRDMGILITTESAAKGDELSDSITRLGQIFQATGRLVANEFAPDVQRGISELTRVLLENKDTAREWGQALAQIMRGIAVVAESEVGRAILFIARLSAELTGIPALLRGLQDLGAMSGTSGASSHYLGFGVLTDEGLMAEMDRQEAEDWKRMHPAAGSRLDFSAPSKAGRNRSSGRDVGAELLKQLQRQYDGLISKTELEKIDLQLLGKEYENINPKLATQIRLLAQLMDVNKAKNDLDKQLKEQAEKTAQLTREVNDTIATQRIEISDLMTGYPDWLRQIENFIDAKRREGYEWEADEIAILRNNAALKEQLRIMAEGATRPRRVFELSQGTETRPRFATTERLEERIAAYHEKLRALAYDLTNTLDNAIRTGFERGAKAGFATLAQGLLNIVENIFLKRLEEGLANLLTNLGSGGGGGGGFSSVLKTILGIVGPAVGGAAAGGSGATWKTIGAQIGFPHASGLNYVPFDNYPALLHQGERVVTAAENRDAGGRTIIINYNAARGEQPASRATVYQMSKQIHAGLAKAALTG